MSEIKYVQTAHLADGHTKGITSVVFNADGSLLASSGLDGAVCVWDTKTWSLLAVYYAKTPVTALAWFTNEALVCGLEDGILSSLVKDNDILRVSGFHAHRLPVEHLSVSGDLVATGAQEDVGIWYWDTDATKVCIARSLPLPKPQTQPDKNVNRSKDQSEVLVTGVFWTTSYLIVTYLNHGIRVFSRETWKLCSAIDAKSSIISGSLSPHGAFLAAANLVGDFDIYDLEAGTVIRTFKNEKGGHARAIPVLFIHGGRAIVGGSAVGRVTIWFVDSGRQLPSLPVPNDDMVLALAGSHSQGFQAYYDSDIDRFILATGLMNEDSKSSIIIWTAGHTPTVNTRMEGNPVDSLAEFDSSAEGASMLLGRAIAYAAFGLVIIYGFAYAILMDQGGLDDNMAVAYSGEL
ncbi:WD40-repeat-containing domain protein [Earliella scabrosa]|nr:WD40-repeat-containing domain protein [Earliella scabrosa]